MKDTKIITTKDGSDTVHLAHLNETYHSIDGAFSESQHVFIENGLKPAIEIFFPDSQHFDHGNKRNGSERSEEIQQKLIVLEVGLGTGLNALLTGEYCHQKNIPLHYIGIEPHPLSASITKKLNYKNFVQPDIKNYWEQIHNGPWEKSFLVTEKFSFLKTKTPLQDFLLDSFFHSKEKIKVNLVYFDGFSPAKAQDVWSLDNFIKLSTLMRHGGILTSYSASNTFRRNLTQSRWQWKSLTGALKKREMTFAQWTS